MARRTRILLALVGLVLVTAAAIWFFRGRAGGGGSVEDKPSGGALTASLRSEPAGYNRYVEATAAADVFALLTQSTLVKVDRTTDKLQPALAESWTQSADGRTYTLTLRRGVQFSDGAPFSSADVLFSARALYNVEAGSVLSSAARVDGQPLEFTAPDAHTVVVRLPAPFTPGLSLLDGMPILPRHRLETAFDGGTFREVWKTGTAPAQLAGLGPFVLVEHAAGQRLVFERNRRYWRRDANGVQLPYLDRLTIAIIPDQNTEALRMQSGEIDLMSSGDIRPEDHAAFRRASEQGRLRLIDVGIGLDPNLLWFNLQEGQPLFAQQAFRQAVSYAIDRQAIVNTVYLGAAVPVYGPVTPGNKTWYSESAPTYPHDPARARELLASIGLKPRVSGGPLHDAAGKPVRFSILTQRGHTIRERTVAMVQEQLRQVGIQVDVAALDPGAMMQRWQDGDYDAIYFGVHASSTDPAIGSVDFWLSRGAFHFWRPRQKTPATDWEARIDDLMRRQASAPTPSERQQLFADMQKIFGEQVPAIYLAAPRVTLAVSSAVANPQPALQIPQLLWSADTLRSTKR